MNQWTVYKERKSLHGGKKKFSLTSAILSVICVVSLLKQRRLLLQLVILSFWWIFLLIAFLLPYGLISSELGTTYIGEGASMIG